MTRAVVATPLRVERLALRGRLRPTQLARTGQGRSRSIASRARLGEPEGLLVAGVGGSLQVAVRPGDVVVASEVRSLETGARGCGSAPLLASALRRCGLAVHVGPILSSATVMHGQARDASGSTGALAVDMESCWLAGPDPRAAFGVVRAIVDAPGAPLLSLGTVPRGVRALRVLRRAAPAIEQWVASVGPRTILLASPNDQDRARAVAREADIVLVAVGAAGSARSRSLVSGLEDETARRYSVTDPTDIDLRWLVGVSTVGICAAASAPPHLVIDLIGSLGGLGPVHVRDRHIVERAGECPLPKEVG